VAHSPWATLFFLEKFSLGFNPNLDRFAENIIFEKRWLFVNLLQSPRSAGWFVSDHPFLYRPSIGARNKLGAKCQIPRCLRSSRIMFDPGAISVPGVLNDYTANMKFRPNGLLFPCIRTPPGRVSHLRNCFPGAISTSRKCGPA
jgi:hypothetical protein